MVSSGVCNCGVGSVTAGVNIGGGSVTAGVNIGGGSEGGVTAGGGDAGGCGGVERVDCCSDEKYEKSNNKVSLPLQ